MTTTTITSHVGYGGVRFTLRNLPNGCCMLMTTEVELIFPGRREALRYALEGPIGF